MQQKVNRNWSIVLIPQRASTQSKSIQIPRVAVALLLVAMLIGGFGLARSVYILGTWAYNRVGMYAEYKKNKSLLVSIQFLENLLNRQNHAVSSLVSLEEQTRNQYGLNSIADDMRQAGIGGLPDAEALARLSLEDRLVVRADSVRLQIAALLRQTSLQESTFVRLLDYVSWKQTQWSQTPSIFPVNGRLTSLFGMRLHPITGQNIFHEGLDIANKTWTPIVSSADGIVTFVGWEQYFGRIVVVTHNSSGFRSAYAHLQKTAVSEGQVIKRGEMVGYLGNSGRTTGPHLHYQVYKWDKLVNPLDYIVPADCVVD